MPRMASSSPLAPLPVSTPAPARVSPCPTSSPPCVLRLLPPPHARRPLLAQVAAVGPAADLTYEYEYLGDSPAALTSLASASSGFGATLKAAKRPIVLLGVGALSRPDAAAICAAAKAVASAAGCCGDGWNGYGVIQTAGGAAGALDIGFVPGPTAAPLNALKAVYLLGADEVSFEQLHPSAFVIYQGHHGDAGASAADLVLPGAAYTEKSATYVNTEGRVQRTARALDPPGNARDDWQILVALSQVIRGQGVRGAPSGGRAVQGAGSSGGDGAAPQGTKWAAPAPPLRHRRPLQHARSPCLRPLSLLAPPT